MKTKTKIFPVVSKSARKVLKLLAQGESYQARLAKEIGVATPALKGIMYRLENEGWVSSEYRVKGIRWYKLQTPSWFEMMFKIDVATFINFLDEE